MKKDNTIGIHLFCVARRHSRKQWRVGIFLFDEVEVLHFAGPYEVFSLTAINRGTPNEWKPFEVTTFSESGAMIKTRNDLQIITLIFLFKLSYV
jgi:hypothetical protein